jgi:hypothetical protein
MVDVREKIALGGIIVAVLAVVSMLPSVTIDDKILAWINKNPGLVGILLAVPIGLTIIIINSLSKKSDSVSETLFENQYFTQQMISISTMLSFIIFSRVVKISKKLSALFAIVFYAFAQYAGIRLGFVDVKSQK